MKPLSYRSRLRLKRIALISLAVLLALVLLAIGIVIYLERYVVYTPEHAYLSFLHPELPAADGDSEQENDFPAVLVGPAGIAVRPSQASDDEPVAETRPDAIRGVYLNFSDLQDPEGCLDAIHAMEDCNTVLFYLKSSLGWFYYDTQLTGSTKAELDTEAVSELIETLRQEGYYLIARVSAFADTAYALDHINGSLQIQGGALWMDADGYYWLDPADEKTQLYLSNTITELAGLGFREIALNQFYYPESPNILYGEQTTEDQSMILQTVVAQLVNLGTSKGCAISFCDPAESTPAPSVDGHLILSGVDGSGVAEVEELYQAQIVDSSSLIFLTDSRDTRFQPYGILRSRELD